MEISIYVLNFGRPWQIAAVLLRERVLRTPLGLKFTEEELIREIDQVHIGAHDGNKIVGTLLLVRLEDATLKMRQVAVDDSLQRRGIGKKMVAYAENWGLVHGYRKMVLHARETAVPFYLQLGYTVTDGPFTEVGIPHRKMEKIL